MTNPLARLSTNMFNYKGVTWESSRGKFMPQIKNPDTGKRRTYGRYDTAEAAARRYDELAREFYGDKAILNFPLENEIGVLLGTPIEIGHCLRGHSYAEFGYFHEGKYNCRCCNLDAVKRYQRLKAKDNPKSLNV